MNAGTSSTGDSSMPTRTSVAASNPTDEKTPRRRIRQTTIGSLAVNEKWMTEKLSLIGIPEAVAKAYAPAIALAVSEEIIRKITDTKLKKLAAKAISQSLK